MSAILLLTAIPLTSAFGYQTSLNNQHRTIYAAEGARLQQKVQQQGKVRVIVRLEIPFQAESRLPAQAASQQRERIKQAQESLIAALSGQGLIAYEQFEQFPLLAVEVNSHGLQRLLADPQVAGVLEDKPIPAALTESIPIVGADQVWLEGVDGSGYLVAVLDTGVDLDHPFLEGKIQSEACFSTTSGAYGSTSLCPDGSEEQIGIGAAEACSISGCDHGTHVAGIAVGSGEAFSGVAKGADLIAIQIFSQFEGDICPEGQSSCLLSFASDQLQALQWIYAQRDSFGSPISSINMSLGSTETYSSACDWDSREPAITNLREVGIATVIASGNGGATDGISLPACISSAISVAASTDGNQRAGFSNVGSILDFFAPGQGITSSVLDGQYGSMSGTSMAAPHVAGGLAVVKSGAPSSGLEAILAALEQTGFMISDGATAEYPRIQVDQALDELLLALTPTPEPTPIVGQWYLAEGYTGSGYGTYILIQNPGDTLANLTASYMLEGGGVEMRNHQIPAQSRYTIVAAGETEVGVDKAFSTLLESDQPIFAERSMYFGNGGHATVGVTTPASTWYLAEGFTGQGFATFILLQNPTGQLANVTVTYMLEGGGVEVREHQVQSQSRYTVVPGLETEIGSEKAFSTRIDADQPIIVERAMYYADGGHNTLGVTQPSTVWYLAEGFTGQGFGTYILLQNPNSVEANVSLTYMIEGGGVEERLHKIPAESRFTIVAADEAEVGFDVAFSTKVDSDQPIIVERAMYWQNGGHNTIGVTDPSQKWHLAEGFTGNGFETFVLLQNPGDVQALVTVTYMLQEGGIEVRNHQVPAQGRYTIATSIEAEVGPDKAFSTQIESDQPIIVERAMYFDAGGHATIGIAK